MLSITGYDIQTPIYEGSRIQVFRGIRLSDQARVVLKLPASAHPSLDELARIQHEYALLSSLDLDGVIGVVELLKVGSRFALVTEDIGATSLRDYLDQHGAFSVELFLRVGQSIAKTLAGLHQRHVIHKDLTPGNIVMKAEDDDVRIIDFGMSTRLPREMPALQQTGHLEGTMRYISPEQTGRMNRPIDYRTDLYTLGATFYHMLTGQYPFDGDDTLDLLHAHLAQMPKAPREVKADIPQTLSDMIMKLMAKAPEERYQRADSVYRDLALCAETWAQHGTIDAFVALEEEEQSGLFTLPNKLYGRESEHATLMRAFQQAQEGSFQLALLTGQAGVGKSALVRELHQPILAHRGFFAAGKFEQFRSHSPYAPFLQAMQGLLDGLLSLEEDQLDEWRERISEALAPNGKLLTDLLPELCHIIGEQPPVDELTPAEAKNRFMLTMTSFVSLFATAEHPLVLFFDDLQWADPDTLKLFEHFAATQLPHLLIVGAYRENEVDEHHPLTAALAHCASVVDSPVHEIVIEPLGRPSISAMLCDMLHLVPEDVQFLTEQLFQKTGGNPFFLMQLLEQFYKRQLLRFSPKEGSWVWDTASIEQSGITDNVVKLLVRKLEELPEATQRLMSLSSCLGASFSLRELSQLAKKPISVLAELLWPAMQEGLLLPTDAHYRFLFEQHEGDVSDEQATHYQHLSLAFGHDNIQEAAYSLLSEQQREDAHASIGRSLLAEWSDAPDDVDPFGVADHLNLAMSQLSPEERISLAEANVQAGKRAIESTAFQAAANYFEAGISLVPCDDWKAHAGLLFALYLEGGRCHYLNGRFDHAEALFDTLLSNVTAPVERANVFVVKMTLYLNTGKLDDVIRLGADGLALFDIDFTTTPTPEEIGAEYGAVAALLSEKGISPEELPSLPFAVDPRQLSIGSLYFFTAMGCYLSGKNDLWQVVVLRMVGFSLSEGNSPFSAYAYNCYGMLIGPGAGDYDGAYQWAQAGVTVADTFQVLAFKCVARFLMGCFISHWKRPINESFEMLDQSFIDGRNSGNLIYCAFSHSAQGIAAVCTGWPLDQMQALSNRALDFAQSIQYDDIAQYYLVYNRWLSALRGETPSLTTLGESRDEEATFLEQLQARSFPMPLHMFYVLKAQLCLLNGDFERGWEVLRQSEALLPASFGLMFVAEHFYYEAMIAAARHSHLTADEQPENIERIETALEKLQAWAKAGPDNFAHKAALVEAELTAIKGEQLQAMSLYARTIQRVLETDFLFDVALSCESAGRFHLRNGRSHEANGYFRNAHHAYLRWGAAAKLEQLRQFASVSKEQQATASSRHIASSSELFELSHYGSATLSSTKASSILDLSILFKATTALSEEIVMESLLDKLLNTVLQHAGAERCCLFLQGSKGLNLEIEGSSGEGMVDIIHHRLLPLSRVKHVCQSIVRYVERTRHTVLLNEATQDPTFGNDTYIQANQTRSLLCQPILNRGNLTGILYLENNLAHSVFTPDRTELLHMLSIQTAISIENARLYNNLEEKVHARTNELDKAIKQLKQQNIRLKETQSQLVQSEKMASLGTLVAGVAHEINNPSNFTYNGALNLQRRLEKLREFLLELAGADAEPEVLSMFDEHFVPLFQNLESIVDGTERIKTIVNDLRTFSRLDEAERKEAHIVDNIESTLSLVKAQFHDSISFVSLFEANPEITCWPAQLNQVFMNIMVNACQAIHKRRQEEGDAPAGELKLRTSITENNELAIRFEDNGCGMTESTKAKVFEPFFTTKPVGSGTGLGLSISYGIIEKHNARVTIDTQVGQGTTFTLFLPLSVNLEAE